MSSWVPSMGGGFGSYVNVSGLERSRHDGRGGGGANVLSGNRSGSRAKRTSKFLTDLFHGCAERLLAPIDGATLGLFRIGFACALFMQALKWEQVTRNFLKSGLLLSYPMFEWVPPVSEPPSKGPQPPRHPRHARVSVTANYRRALFVTQHPEPITLRP
jgi:hypothetical protein